MDKRCIDRALEKMNALQKEWNKLDGKAWDAYQEGNIKRADHFDKKQDEVALQIKGFESCLKSLGLGVWWCGEHNEWVIPLDDIERVC